MVRKYWDQITGNQAHISINSDGGANLAIIGDKCILLDKDYANESTARSVLFRRPGLWSRFRMSEDERSLLSGKIYKFVRCYDAHTYTLPKVFNELMKELVAHGYDVEVEDVSHRDYKLFIVDGRRFRLYRQKGWSEYQIY